MKEVEFGMHEILNLLEFKNLKFSQSREGWMKHPNSGKKTIILQVLAMMY